MSKVLITKNNLDSFLEKEDKSFLVDKNFILTPGAIDILDERNIKIIYKNDIEENIVERITRLLREDFKIEDYGEIEKITNLVLEKINN
ncbi:hypothetical protein [Anaerosalibacter massiliensis]|uniref:Uncharacterized protein n=1 Tax=Anaerosalibacter massiliensis TaxID=1347392 RepID=A0A9X2MHN5_9FIRM|nr:hypothetical protein [Anaerosalibacter massiliensis]MCR2043834.1 hypothetical protein [Anaerosalibacter massiliensis]